MTPARHIDTVDGDVAVIGAGASNLLAGLVIAAGGGGVLTGTVIARDLADDNALIIATARARLTTAASRGLCGRV